MRYIICTLILLAFIWVVRSGLYSFLDAFGFWPFMAFCAALNALIISAAFAWDYYEARR